VKDLRTKAEKSHYSSDVLADLDLLASALQREKARAFDRYREHIADELQIEIDARLRGDTGRIKASLIHDPQLHVAMALLKDQKFFKKRLGL
jgi:hypothetical protein